MPTKPYKTGDTCMKCGRDLAVSPMFDYLTCPDGCGTWPLTEEEQAYLMEALGEQQHRQPMTEREYTTARGTLCPACGSDDLQAFAGDIKMQDNNLHSPTECNRCGATWREWYSLDGYSELYDREGEPLEIPDAQPRPEPTAGELMPELVREHRLDDRP